MCGIAGYIGSAEIPDTRVRACLDLMGRRGPDFAAAYHHRTPGGRNANLLHSRLSIIDLDPRSNGPFRVGDRVMTYNGELYNYVELKDAMARRGERFSTEGDTEVLIRHLAHGGAAALDDCEGMWAFALYDEADGSLLLSRDRFGEKPLYLVEDHSGVYFGSEIKFVRALLGRDLEIDYDHLYRYMVNGYKALYKERYTFFHGVRELAPGTVMAVDGRGTTIEQRYWNPVIGSDDSLTYGEAVTQARDAIIEAVRIRLRADVPLAFCMSGGVDSNTLISIAKRMFDYDVHGFTIVNTDERYEEQDFIEYAVGELGIRHTSVPVETGGFLGNLRTLIRQHDSPVYTITYYAHWLLMRAIAEAGYRISLSGTAADELFSGYYDHHLAYLAAVHGDPVRHREAVAEWSEHVKPLVRNPFLSDPDLFVRDPSFRDHIYLDAAEFASYLHQPWGEPFRESAYSPELLRNRMLNELFHESVPVILHEDDHNAMYYSIENRSPFLDRNLFETCYGIPTRHLIQHGLAKAVLRDSMRGIVPTSILDNPRKVGFNAPVYAFLDPQDPAVRSELLADSPIWDHVKREAIEDLIAKPDLPNSESKFLFYFVNSKLFLEEFAS